jgi:hypothetical protein
VVVRCHIYNVSWSIYSVPFHLRIVKSQEKPHIATLDRSLQNYLDSLSDHDAEREDGRHRCRTILFGLCTCRLGNGGGSGNGRHDAGIGAGDGGNA